jgi:hypothetical protein
MMREYDIVLRRANGRKVKVLATAPSIYSAKKAADKKLQGYDDNYYTTIEPRECPA